MLDRMQQGDIAKKHHVQLRGAGGELRYEECFTRDGFDGPYTILYHLRRPHLQRVTPPQHGKVETRPGPVVIGPNWVGGGNCVGTTLQGVNVFYVPASGFSGSDAFSLDVVYSKRRIVRAEVAVTVR